MDQNTDNVLESRLETQDQAARDLVAEKQTYQRMIDHQSTASREYTEGKFRSVEMA